MPRSSSTASKSCRRHFVLPGILMPTMQQRWEEFGYPSLAPYALELICFDLRKRREPIITLLLSRETAKVQEAIDRLLVRRYVPGPDQRGPLIQTIFGEPIEPLRQMPRGVFAAHRGWVRYSERIAPCIEERWQEAGYESFSAYLTGLIRYDFLLLGPHRYYNGADIDPEILDSMDRGTERDFRENKPQPLYLDRLLDQAAGRKLTAEERVIAMRKIAADLCTSALKADKPSK